MCLRKGVRKTMKVAQFRKNKWNNPWLVVFLSRGSKHQLSTINSVNLSYYMKINRPQLVGAVVTLLSATQANAALINGEINFAGSATLNQSASTATSIVAFNNVTVGYGTQEGAYATTVPLDGDAVTFGTFSFSSGGSLSLSPNPVTVWSFNDLGVNYSFKLTSVVSADVSVHNKVPTLSVEGFGMAHIDGYQDTPGDFTITLTGKNAHVTFGAASYAPVSHPSGPVPEPSSWAMISGLGLVSYSLLRRVQK